MIPGSRRPPIALQERPLAGLRIVLTRPREQAGEFMSVVSSLGGRPEIAPAIEIAPPQSWSELDAALGKLDRYAWIAFTSANAVRSLAGRARALGMGPASFAPVKLAAVGRSTADVLAAELRPPDAIASSASASALGSDLEVSPGTRVLLPLGELAGDDLAAVLRVRGAEVAEVTAYRTVPGDGIPAIVAGWLDETIAALLFASGSAVSFVAEALSAARTAHGDVSGVRPAIFCIGPSTASAAVTAGFEPDGVSATATQQALIDEMVRWFAEHRPGNA
ncbi:MAG TPA: uroporphyrinogen-III synthase [Gemmatimonadaceae bacterium]|nr:uroporphyrinogen-III synthase [Gemmatimonadaceae bacterium]